MRLKGSRFKGVQGLMIVQGLKDVKGSKEFKGVQL
jgi:hypothetical protein